MKRRDFLRGLPAVAAGLGLGARAAEAAAPGGLRPPGSRSAGDGGGDMSGPAAALPTAVGIQLYTLRSLMQSDPEGTLAALAGIGYDEVERAGLAGRPVGEFRRMLGRSGLRAVSGHESLDAVLLGPGIEQAAALGQSWIVVPSLDADRHSPDGYRRTADDFNRAGERARAAGLRFAFHNHAREFQRLDDGTHGYGILLERCDPALVSFQLDVFWAVEAGQDPLALFAAHPGRFSSLHVKDRAADGSMVDVGRGVIDFGAVLAASDAAGVQHLFVEHDNPGDPLAFARISYATVRGILNRLGGARPASPEPLEPR